MDAPPPTPRPAIVQDPIPYGARRQADMRAYADRHYGVRTARLRAPRVIVEHLTANTSYRATWRTFAPNRPDPELGELPGVCAHFVVDPDGRIHQLVSLRFMCRHTVGLNHVSIGIEHVGTSERAVLRNRRMLLSSLRLTRWLQARHRIATRDVIGHRENRSHRLHRERVVRLRSQTHADWPARWMRVYRDAL